MAQGKYNLRHFIMYTVEYNDSTKKKVDVFNKCKNDTPYTFVVFFLRKTLQPT
jgi:hypothetical protein